MDTMKLTLVLGLLFNTHSVWACDTNCDPGAGFSATEAAAAFATGQVPTQTDLLGNWLQIGQTDLDTSDDDSFYDLNADPTQSSSLLFNFVPQGFFSPVSVIGINGAKSVYGSSEIQFSPTGICFAEPFGPKIFAAECRLISPGKLICTDTLVNSPGNAFNNKIRYYNGFVKLSQ